MSALPQQEMVLSKAMLFQPILKQNYILNRFNNIYMPQTAIQHSAPIELLAMGADNLYIDLGNSNLSIKVKNITKLW